MKGLGVVGEVDLFPWKREGATEDRKEDSLYLSRCAGESYARAIVGWASVCCVGDA
jgi:hypothetical protein